jgi:hypothetical protein
MEKKLIWIGVGIFFGTVMSCADLNMNVHAELGVWFNEILARTMVIICGAELVRATTFIELELSDDEHSDEDFQVVNSFIIGIQVSIVSLFLIVLCI